jgi:hypothetical protein
MEQRVSLITLGVKDLSQSREFYERLGWRRSMAKTEGIVFFQAGGVALALYPREELAKEANVSSEGRGFNGMTLAYNTRNREEVDSVMAQAQRAGAKLLKPAQEAFWGGYSGYFSDPDGSCGRWPGIHLSRSPKMEAFAFPTNTGALVQGTQL